MVVVNQYNRFNILKYAYNFGVTYGKNSLLSVLLIKNNGQQLEISPFLRSPTKKSFRMSPMWKVVYEYFR